MLSRTGAATNILIGPAGEPLDSAERT